MLEAEAKKRASFNRLRDYRPYPKQAEFHALGRTNDEGLFLAGNQLGKTWAGGFETAIHLTGRYPDWWNGRVFDHPIRAMAGSESSELTRKGVQRILLGPPEIEDLWGSGSIPKDAIKDWSRKQGVPNTIDNIVTTWGGGGDVQARESVIQFASYDQGRTKWQADTLDFVWFDEEPPEAVYLEGITRVNATRGYAVTTFTPLLGMSKVVMRFYPKPQFPRCQFVMMGLDDAEHLTPEDRARILSKYPAHERDARAKGTPKLGSGAVFPLDVELLKTPPIPIPDHWPQICGIDFGYDHPSAGVRLAWDRDADVIYVIAVHRARQQTPALFAPSVKPWGAWMPWAWPHDGLQHDKGSGIELAAQYRSQGLNMLIDKATHPPKPGENEGSGGNGVEAGVSEMLDRMQTGRLKVFSHLADWFEEFGLYHRKDGIIVKEHDDLLCATRYAVMMKRFAIVKPRAKAYVEQEAGHWMS